MEGRWWGGATRTGRVRRVNEDAFLASPPIFAVADGMGGHAAGDVASALAVGSLSGLVGRLPHREEVLHHIREADAAIARAGTAPGREGMGTTLCVLAVLAGGPPGTLLIANVGDSRAYRLDGTGLHQVTRDHSVVQEQIDAGALDPSAAATHAHRHVVTRSLGAGVRLDIDWWLLDRDPSAAYLLASDGLTRELTHTAIVDLIAGASSPQEAADALVDEAVAAGGRDNVTAVVVLPGTAHAESHDPLDADTDPRPPIPA